MKKFLRRLGKTRFMVLVFLLLCVANYLHRGWPGIVAAIIGWSIAMLICNWSEYKPRIIKFLRRRTNFQIKLAVKLIIFVPIAIAAFCYGGWQYLLTAIAGWCIGELIGRRFLEKNP